MNTIWNDDFRALCLAHAQYQGDLVYVEIGGNLGSARAIAFDLLSNHKRQFSSGIKIGDEAVHLEKHAKYYILMQRSARRRHGITTKVALLHKRLTIADLAPEKIFFYLEAGNDLSVPPDGFIDRLRGASKVPLQDDEAQWLWECGKKEHTYITSMPHAMRVHTARIPPLRFLSNAEGCIIVIAQATKTLWENVVREHNGLILPLSRPGGRYGKTSVPYVGEEGSTHGYSISYNSETVRWELMLDGELVVWRHDKENNPLYVCGSSADDCAVKAWGWHGVQLKVRRD
jgi:hypothetical protein